MSLSHMFLQTDLLDTVGRWLVDQINVVMSFLLYIFYFTICLYLTVVILRYKNTTTLNEANQKFFKRSFTTTFAMAIILGILAVISLVLIMSAFIAMLGGGGGTNPMSSILMATGIGSLGQAIFATETSGLIFFAILGLILILIAMGLIHNAFRVKYGWALLGLIVMLLLGIGIEYILETYVHFNLFNQFATWSQTLENFIRDQAYPPTI